MTAARCVMGMVDVSQPAAAAAPAPTQLTDTSDDLLTVSVSEVGLQTSDAKVLLISMAEVKEGRDRYFKAEGGKPPRAEAPTREQITVCSGTPSEVDHHLPRLRGIRPMGRKSTGSQALRRYGVQLGGTAGESQASWPSFF